MSLILWYLLLNGLRWFCVVCVGFHYGLRVFCSWLFFITFFVWLCYFGLIWILWVLSLVVRQGCCFARWFVFRNTFDYLVACFWLYLFMRFTSWLFDLFCVVGLIVGFLAFIWFDLFGFPVLRWFAVRLDLVWWLWCCFCLWLVAGCCLVVCSTIPVGLVYFAVWLFGLLAL